MSSAFTEVGTVRIGMTSVNCQILLFSSYTRYPPPLVYRLEKFFSKGRRLRSRKLEQFGLGCPGEKFGTTYLPVSSGLQPIDIPLEIFEGASMLSADGQRPEGMTSWRRVAEDARGPCSRGLGCV
ncbi:hypothetical protein CEXT_101391 [Caerostris extrusa]|uniref:Uncharacterized protein n=1 Tax=Caerostris extrusa TaxID=172846 RepID=A0AAV4MMK7_CAEEX|nr:hypothetical protein CEXT_101391 [Caerostris extrusa]